MKIIVTGGCGFIGSNFIRMFLQTEPAGSICNVDKLTYAGNPSNLADVEANFSDRYSFEKADIADVTAMRRILEEQNADVLINFAAESHVDRSIVDATPFIHTNVQGTQCLLTVAGEQGIGLFIHISTDEVYGSLSLNEPERAFKESDSLSPNSPYAASKAGSDLLCRAWHETYGLPIIITRCSNNYGPCQFPEKLIPHMYLSAMKDAPLPIYGDGKNIRDWIHVEDHCRGILLALRKGTPGNVYNFGGSAERSNFQVVQEILRFCGKDESLIRYVTDRPGHDRRYAMNYDKAASELGFCPTRNFEQGLKETLTWYAGNSDWVDGVTSGAYLSFSRKWYGERQ